MSANQRALEMIKSATREKPVNSGLISRQTGLSGESIRDLVNSSRREGLPVCSGRKGYWLASNEDEINETIQNLLSRIAGMEGAVAGLRKSKIGMTQYNLDSIIDSL